MRICCANEIGHYLVLFNYIYSAMCLFIYYISNYSTYDLCTFMIISLVAEISTFEFLKL